MFKKWLVQVFTMALCAVSVAPLSAQEDRFTPAGKQIVSEVEVAYQNGEYDVFLQQLDKQYKRAGKAGVLRGVFESAKVAMPSDNSVEDRKRYRLHIVELDQERNKKLFDAIAEDKETPIAQKVDSVASYSLPTEQIEVLAELDSLKYQIPEDAKATLQNKMSALEIEFYIKSLLLDIAAQTSGSTPEDLHKKKAVLGLKKLDKMEAVAKEFNDENWIKKIDLAKEANRAERAYKVDLESLNAIATGKIVAENSIEEKVKAVMMDSLTHKEQNLAEIAQK